ncbi:hypothetical protein EV199_5400 [Pseudobacter ginsenosidimutans]|uniref:Uncharacterized protein n=1 Tax=Pseudobacter ginsenosidimutans TaxID=661488 RepID=A0A4Q7MFR1_9BACT|nr:hypothetical protein EV199_5400 [Pseudobacter ginsenosidimutans]
MGLLAFCLFPELEKPGKLGSQREMNAGWKMNRRGRIFFGRWWGKMGQGNMAGLLRLHFQGQLFIIPLLHKLEVRQFFFPED